MNLALTRRQRAGLSVVTAGCIALAVAAPASASTLTAREPRRYVPVGDAVKGTSSPAGAPALKPGQYTDTLSPDEQKNYTVTLADGVTPYFSVTLIRPIGVVPGLAADYVSFSDDIKISIGTADGVACGYDDASTSQDQAVGPALATARPGRVGNEWASPFSGPSSSNCGKPGKYVISLSRTQSSTSVPNRDLPIEIVYIAEPPLADDATTLPGQHPISTSSLAPDVTAVAKAIKGGGSYSEAAELAKSGGYTDTIKPGETLYYRIRLGQGQRLGYTVLLHGQKSLDEFIDVVTYLGTPYRGVVVNSNDTGSYSSSDDETLSGQMSAPVAYRNRESDADAVEQLRLGGYYYLTVTMANPDKATQTEVPINIAVKVAGEATDAPKYRKLEGTSDLDNLGLPGQESPGVLVRKVAYFAGGGLALTLALLVLLVPLVRRRQPQ